MTKTAILLISALLLGCSYHGATVDRPLQVKPSPTPQDDKLERKTLIGKVPKDDFAMPLIASEILPGSIQGCFVTADTEECIVALYLKGMARPDREMGIQVKGRMQVVTSTAPSSPTAKIYMRYSQKVMIIDSWEYSK